MLLLQHCKLVMHSDESAEECIDRMRITATECEYKKWDRRVKNNS